MNTPDLMVRSDTVSSTRLEAACCKALTVTPALVLKGIRSSLQFGQDKLCSRSQRKKNRSTGALPVVLTTTKGARMLKTIAKSEMHMGTMASGFAVPAPFL